MTYMVSRLLPLRMLRPVRYLLEADAACVMHPTRPLPLPVLTVHHCLRSCSALPFLTAAPLILLESCSFRGCNGPYRHIVTPERSLFVQAGEMLRAMGFKDVSAMASYRHWVDAGGPIQLPSPPPRPIGVPAAAQI